MVICLVYRAFGEVRTVRLPKKMAVGEETHRGFGFVDFFSESDAKVRCWTRQTQTRRNLFVSFYRKPLKRSATVHICTAGAWCSSGRPPRRASMNCANARPITSSRRRARRSAAARACSMRRQWRCCRRATAMTMTWTRNKLCLYVLFV